MRIDLLAKRDAIAIEAIGEAMQALSERHGVGADAVSAFQSAIGKDRAIVAMQRNEALVDFLSALASCDSAPPIYGDLLEKLTAIPGIGDAKAKQIIKTLEGK